MGNSVFHWLLHRDLITSSSSPRHSLQIVGIHGSLYAAMPAGLLMSRYVTPEGTAGPMPCSSVMNLRVLCDLCVVLGMTCRP